MRFTDRSIAALKPKATRYEAWEGGRTGFGVRVSPKGLKTWVWMYRFGGKARRLTFGNYPAVGLASASVKLAQAKDLLDHGEDPGAQAKTEKRADRDAATVRQLVNEYLERSAKGLRSYAEIKRMLEREVIPAWGGRKARAIKRRDVIVLLDGMVDRGAPVAANRVLSWTRRLWNFGIRRDLVEANPCVGIEAPAKEVERERVLTDDEIRALWSGLPEAKVTPAIRLAAMLVLATAQRPGEVAGAMVSEFDLKERLWNLPPSRTKNRRPHMVPLSDMAVKLVEEAIAKTARDGFLFPSPTGNASIGSRALSKAFLRNAAELGIPEPPKPGKGQKVDPALKTARRRERRAMAFAPHDLRRSAASRMAELGFTRFAVGRILNHTEAGVGRVYDRYEYLKEKRAALDAWARQLDIILSGKKAKGAEVVALRRG